MHPLRSDMSVIEKFKQIHWGFFFLLCCVAFCGFVTLYSAAGGNVEPWAARQGVRFALFFVGMVMLSLVDLRVIFRSAYIAYFIILLLLLIVEIRGDIGMGAQRWLDIGFMRIQPSELMKIVVIISLARYFHEADAERMGSIGVIIPALVLIMIPMALVLIQPDLGTSIKILAVGVSMMFLAGVGWWFFALGAVGAVGISFVGWHFLHDYQKQRVFTFLNPESDPLGSGYHILQSKIALGSGGIWGRGFLEGTQSHLSFLPEKQTDFIFTMFAEEWGLIGGILVILLYGTLAIFGFLMSINCNSIFARLLGLGVSLNFFFYFFINIAMVMGLLPVVGIPLPLFSYGGTAMLGVMIGFGLLMNAHINRDLRLTRRGGAV